MSWSGPSSDATHAKIGRRARSPKMKTSEFCLVKMSPLLYRFYVMCQPCYGRPRHECTTLPVLATWTYFTTTGSRVRVPVRSLCVKRLIIVSVLAMTSLYSAQVQVCAVAPKGVPASTRRSGGLPSADPSPIGSKPKAHHPRRANDSVQRRHSNLANNLEEAHKVKFLRREVR